MCYLFTSLKAVNCWVTLEVYKRCVELAYQRKSVDIHANQLKGRTQAKAKANKLGSQQLREVLIIRLLQKCSEGIQKRNHDCAQYYRVAAISSNENW